LHLPERARVRPFVWEGSQWEIVAEFKEFNNSTQIAEHLDSLKGKDLYYKEPIDEPDS
jgi:gamma-glutamylcyclotransferase (GGCT)/AIG2-like uncharacterized protein YtfP